MDRVHYHIWYKLELSGYPVEVIPESVNHSLLDNFTEKEIFCNRGQLDLICTSLQISIAHSNETLPHIISTLPK